MLTALKNKTNRLYVLGIVFYCLLFSLARFPGLESHSGYFGMAYSLIHPESFPDDISARYHPAMVSWYSLLVKLAGDLWLDDRFNMAVYFLLTILSFWALERIIKVCGVKHKGVRLAIMAIVAAHHTFIDSVPSIIDTVCYRPSTYVYPVGLWMAYFLFKGKEFNKVLLFSFLIVTVSFKNGWFPAFAALTIAVQERFQIKWNKIIALFLIIVPLVFVFNYAHLSFKGTVYENARLFDLTLSTTENSEANPFINGLGPFLFVLLLLLTIKLELSDKFLEQRIKALCVISLVVYLLGGVYCTFAPDVLKIPFFVAMAVSRSTWWTQILIFTILSVYLFQKIDLAVLKRNASWLFLLFILYILPFFDYYSLASYFNTGKITLSKDISSRVIVYIFVLAFWVGGYFLSQKGFLRRKGDALIIKPWMVIILPFILTACISVIYKLHTRFEHVIFLYKHGIVGDTHGAKWVGVNEFIREHTDPKSNILAFSGDDLRSDTALRIRTGRTMPLASHEIAFYFNYQKRLKQASLTKKSEAFSSHWKNCELMNIENDLKDLNNPDYIIIPSGHSCDVEKLGYWPIKEINNFLIYKKTNNS